MFKYRAVYCLMVIDSQCLKKDILFNSFSAMLKYNLLFNTIGNKKTWSIAMKFDFPLSGVLLLTCVCILVAA